MSRSPMDGRRTSVATGPSVPASDYRSTSLAVAVGTSVRVWDASANELPSSSAVMAKANVSPTAISWNRNNKVAAVGLENGRVQIRYANGTCMSTLRDDYHDDGHDDLQPVSSLSWSTGSKTLAVGTVGGRVSVHDMTNKQHLSKVISPTPSSSASASASGTKLKAVGLQHHPDDAFLAVGGKESVELYSLRLEEAKGSCVCSASAVVKNDACFSSVSVATGKPYLAAGSDRNGIVAVWDYATGSELACDKFRHAHKGSTKVALAPLEPYLLYSVGMDGILKMQDLRAPSSIASPTAMASVTSTAGIASMSVHEYSGDIALGTNDGYVYVFTGGLSSRQPKHSLFFGDELRDEDCPVLALDWARSYHNVTLHARQVVAESERMATPLRAVTREQAVVAGGSTRVAREETPSTSQDTSNTLTTANTANTAGHASPLVQRTLTADPWRIRAANVIDGDANTPSSSAGPTRTNPRQTPSSGAKKTVVATTAVGTTAVETTAMTPPLAAETASESGVVRGTPGASAVNVSNADVPNEELSQLILALHLDMVQMNEASSAEVRALREEVSSLKEEVSALKELVAQSAKPSGEVWGI